MDNPANTLKLVRLGIDTKDEFTLYLHVECLISKSEGFEAHTQIVVAFEKQSIVAILHVVHSDILKIDEASLSESAWKRLGVYEEAFVHLSHLKPVKSLNYVRAKILGNEINAEGFHEIIQDIVAGKYSHIHLASFISACSKASNLSVKEITYLTQAMIQTGEQLQWDSPLIMDKHCIGGVPGNRTSPIIVAIVAAAGLIIPKTSSRAITSPAGTADTVETMTPVSLSIPHIRKVVNKEGGCLVWGGALGLTPADDIIIRIERALAIDPEGPMIASVLAKKAAIGATYVVIDIPVGPCSKVHSDQDFLKLKEHFATVCKVINLNSHILKSDGTQPIGKGMGPALEAKDILAVLNNDKNAPADLKDKALTFAGIILEAGNKAPAGKGKVLAKEIVEKGAALKKFIAICEAQGGFREPPTAAYSYEVVATTSGVVTKIDNRGLTYIAKLAGAPSDPAAGIEFFAKLGTPVEKGQLIYRIHAESKGELEYSLEYAHTLPNVVEIT